MCRNRLATIIIVILYPFIFIVVQAYGNSKAAQIMFGEHLAREVEARGANVKIIR